MKLSIIILRVISFIVLPVANSNSSEWSLQANINSRAEYNDNISLVLNPADDDAVSSLTIAPSVIGSIINDNHSIEFEAKVRDINYSGVRSDSTSQYFTFTDVYSVERNSFSFSSSYVITTTVNPDEEDLGISISEVNKETKGLSFQYSRFFSNRLNGSLSYNASNVNFLEETNTSFTPYLIQTVTGIMSYAYTNRARVSLTLQGSNYDSDDDTITYQSYILRPGLAYSYTQNIMLEFSLGLSKYNSSNLRETSFDYFNNPAPLPDFQVIDQENNGIVATIVITKQLENGGLSLNLSRDESTNSAGGLAEVDSITLSFNDKISSRLGYQVISDYKQNRNITTGIEGTNRDIFSFLMKADYTLDKNWVIDLSLRQIRRDLLNISGATETPRSNIIYMSMTYNFAPISTF